MKAVSKIGILLVVLFLTVLGIGISKYCYGKSETDKNVEYAGQYVLKALKIKYKKDFAIKDGHYITNTGGYEFNVYPKNDPEFTFNAWLNGMTESGESDGYLLSMHDHEEKQMIAPYIKSISDDYFIDTVAPSPIPNVKGYEQMVTDMYKYQMSVSEMLEKFSGKIQTIIQVHINYNITPDNEDSVLKKVYNLIEFLKKKKFGSIRISLFFYNLPNKKISELGKEDINFAGDYLLKADKRIVVTPQNISSIKRPNDLKKYVKDIIRSID